MNVFSKMQLTVDSHPETAVFGWKPVNFLPPAADESRERSALLSIHEQEFLNGFE